MTTVLTPFSTRIEVSAASMAELVAFHNSQSGKPAIKKFETRAKGVERCLTYLKPEGLEHPKGITPTTEKSAAVKAVAKAEHSARKAARKPGPVVTVVANPMSAIVKTVTSKTPLSETRGATAGAKRPSPAPAKKSAPAKTKKAPAATSTGARFDADTAKITILHKGDNPKHGSAAERYALYRNGMTVTAYIAAGGQRRDVVWDQKQGWISVK